MILYEHKKLPPEFKAKWIKALRSGEYAQTKEVLKDDDGYCCLGVACAIAGSFFVPRFPGHLLMPFQVDTPLDFPPMLLGYVKDSGILEKLTTMNDDGHSFLMIADWIETNL